MTHRSVRETQRLIDAREFQEWQEYYRIEPFGDDWDQAATIAATTVNLWSKKKVKPSQFIPSTKPKRDAAQVEADMMRFARMHNAAVDRRQKREKNKPTQPKQRGKK